jgi:hypothetical protein
VAFVGPSGAGKSTACRHVDEARLFSVDRLAVAPAWLSAPGLTAAPERPAHFGAGPRPRARWLAHPLPGGTRPVPDMPSAPERALPLAGLLRVQRATLGTRLERHSPAPAVATLRESAFQIGAAPSAESELLAVLDRLAQDVPVARLELLLRTSLTPLLRRWLVDQAEEPK